MSNIYNSIRELSAATRLSKHERIVQGITTAIEDRVVERGELLPSINQMAGELGFARKTIDKAYRELKDRGLVDSQKRRGFFVSTEAANQTLRVALLLYEFRPFQERFYNAFRESLGDHVEVRTFFHHNDLLVFEDTIEKISGRFGMYVVAPIVHDRTPEILAHLPENRLLLIDRHVTLRRPRPFVIQEFRDSTLSVLRQLAERISCYDRVELFFEKEEGKAYPEGILLACERFCSDRGIPLLIKRRYEMGSIERNVLYLTVGDNDLWSLLEDCIDRGYVLGEDIGLLSHNESRIKKLVHGGVSTWSTDFERMAREAARLVMKREPEEITIPTVLIDRKSL